MDDVERSLEMDGIYERFMLRYLSRPAEEAKEALDEFSVEATRAIAKQIEERRKSLSCPNCHFQMDRGNNGNLVCSTCNHSQRMEG